MPLIGSQRHKKKITDQILILMKVGISQNYFVFLNKMYQPDRGAAMGSSISSTNAEIFLQYFEDKHIQHLPDTKHRTFYTRYVDDILIICNSKKIHLDLITASMNQIHKDIKFNPSHEDNRQIS